MVVSLPHKTGIFAQEFPAGNGHLAPGLAFLPSAEKTANQNDLPQVIRVVVRDEQGFAKNGLSGAVGNACEEVGLGICDQFFHRRKISRK